MNIRALFLSTAGIVLCGMPALAQTAVGPKPTLNGACIVTNLTVSSLQVPLRHTARMEFACAGTFFRNVYASVRIEVPTPAGMTAAPAALAETKTSYPRTVTTCGGYGATYGYDCYSTTVEIPVSASLSASTTKSAPSLKAVGKVRWEIGYPATCWRLPPSYPFPGSPSPAPGGNPILDAFGEYWCKYTEASHTATRWISGATY